MRSGVVHREAVIAQAHDDLGAGAVHLEAALLRGLAGRHPGVLLEDQHGLLGECRRCQRASGQHEKNGDQRVGAAPSRHMILEEGDDGDR